MKTKFIFITGGVLSSLGKGLSGGFHRRAVENAWADRDHPKLDPYINVDPEP